MHEVFIAENILDQYSSGPQVCPDYSGKALGFNSCFTAFLCFLVGIFFCILLFLMEMWARITQSSFLNDILTYYNKHDNEPNVDVYEALSRKNEEIKMLELQLQKSKLNI